MKTERVIHFALDEYEVRELLDILNDWSHNFAEHTTQIINDCGLEGFKIQQETMNENCDELIELFRKVLR